MRPECVTKCEEIHSLIEAGISIDALGTALQVGGESDYCATGPCRASCGLAPEAILMLRASSVLFNSIKLTTAVS